VQDALANFIEILPMIPDHIIAKRIDDLINLLKEKLKVAIMEYEIEKEDDFNRILVCNNSCWALGELAQINPEAVNKYSTDIF
jgi:hypothetical protein